MPHLRQAPDPQHALLDAVFTHAPVGLAFWDRDLRYQRINAALAEINGLPPEAHLGRTLPEILGELGTEAEAMLRDVLDHNRPVTGVEIDGETPAQPGVRRHWLASYHPVVGGEGSILGVAGAVLEVSEQHEAELERRRLLRDAVTARAHAEAARLRAEDAQAAAEQARARTEFLSEAGRRLAESMDAETSLQQVAEIAVPTVADWCAIMLLEGPRKLRTVAVAHVDPAKVELARELAERYPPDFDAPMGAGAVVRGGELSLVPSITSAMLEGAARDPEHLELLRELGLRASLMVPLRIPGRILGVVSLIMAESGRTFGRDDVSLATGLAARAALHVRNAQLYTERSHIARTLQASLLPRTLPDIAGLEVAARYLAAGDANDVGGDFYDVFPSGTEGVWTALIGDVTGKGPEAAALTSLVRHTLRATALREVSPSENLRVLNRAMLADADSTRFSTVLLTRIRPSPGRARLTMASGGHPAPIVLRRDGTLEPPAVSGTLVGGVAEPEFADADVELRQGDLIVFYTDGVTELRTGDPAYGERRLAETLTAHAGRGADEVADAVLRAAVALQDGPPRDDIALLVLRVA